MVCRLPPLAVAIATVPCILPAVGGCRTYFLWCFIFHGVWSFDICVIYIYICIAFFLFFKVVFCFYSICRRGSVVLLNVCALKLVLLVC